MFAPFFALAARSPTRQASLRRAMATHVLVLAATALVMNAMSSGAARQLLGSIVLVAGIIEGATLLGWRLTQLPKSQALEFLLVSPLRPARLLFAEALVGLTFLALVTLAGLPVLAILAAVGYLDPLDLLPLAIMPFTWGAITGIGLTLWAYEPARVRKLGEFIFMGGIVLYLVIGVLAGENLKHWIDFLPAGISLAVLRGFASFHTHNPFGVMKLWLESDINLAWERALGLQLAATAAVMILLWRACRRLEAHFHELHYQPVADVSGQRRARVGDRPLAWWAVKRVTKYSGRINLWLAGGFGILYAVYTVAGPYWPSWMGRRIFELADGAGGIPGVAAGLVLLAAVPAAFQYGLWDSTTQDRCRRLELLLLTDLHPRDYWQAAAAAAWRRGRGYFAIALLLWTAALVAGQIGLGQMLTAMAAAVLLWGLYFALGFRAFSRGLQANGLGMILTVGLPLIAYGLYRLHWPMLGKLLPPGLVYSAAAQSISLQAVAVWAGLTILVARWALAHGDDELRTWYDANVGSKILT